MNDSKWPEATAVAATALAAACILTPWGRVGAVNWEALSAIATTLAVVAALGVPAWQRRVVKRDAELAELRHEFIMAAECIRTVAAVRTTLTEWSSFQAKPSESHLLALRSELAAARNNTHTPVLRHMFADASEILASIHAATVRTPGESKLMDGLSGLHVQSDLADELGDLLNMGYTVQEDMLKQFKRLGEPPAIYSSRG